MAMFRSGRQFDGRVRARRETGSSRDSIRPSLSAMRRGRFRSEVHIGTDQAGSPDHRMVSNNKDEISDPRRFTNPGLFSNDAANTPYIAVAMAPGNGGSPQTRRGEGRAAGLRSMEPKIERHGVRSTLIGQT
jgi:hypothetical protein